MDTTNVGILGASQNTINSAIGLAQNFDDFLQLLTTQLQNQDPLEPLNATEFTTQLVQFASVEQQIGQNSRLDELLKVQSGSQAVGAVSFLDTIVEAFGDKAVLTGGEANFTYTLASKAESASIIIRDETGKIVRTLDGELGAGKHNLVWDGKDDQGVLQKDGVYSISVSAKDADGKTIETKTGTIGKVSGVTVKEGVLVLDLGGITVKVTDVVSVKRPDETGQGGTS